MMFRRTILSTILFATVADAQTFTIEDALSVGRIVGQPQVSRDGTVIAYLLADWQNDDAILAHKPLGRLLVYTVADGSTVTVAEEASDPEWSGSGRSLAFFQHSGSARELVIRTGPAFDGAGKRFPVAGLAPRYSARYFAPIWTSNCSVVVREVTHQVQSPSVREPYTITSDEEQLAIDTHFRDDTESRLIRIDGCSGQRTPLTDAMALRAIHPGPDGRRIAIASALREKRGYFAGDTYVQSLRYTLVDSTDGSQQPLALDQNTAILGWTDNVTLLVRAPAGIIEVDADSGQHRTRLPSESSAFATGFAIAGDKLAAWGPATVADSERYVIPPPVPHRLVIATTRESSMREIVSAKDGLEVLQGKWFDAGRRLLVHARRLDTLAAQILVWQDGRIEHLEATPSAFGPIGVAATGNVAAFAVESAVWPPELHVLNADTEDMHAASEHNARYADQTLVSPDLIAGKAGDGIGWQALVFRPANTREGGNDSLVVRAYGRQTDARYHFNVEAQMHVARGYVYALPDVYPLRGELRSAYAAVLPAAIRRIRRDYALHGKTGFVGGSLGGYAGLALLTGSKVADAAVLRAPPVEFTMSWATGRDRDADLLEYLMQGERPDQDPVAYRADSPLHAANTITAPILFLHGTDDAQVPLWQSQAMFQALRRLGNAPTALRIYPGADHKIVRGSRSRYIDFYEQIFAWWQQHLRVEPE